MALRLLTWNVEGLNETRLGQRMEKLCLAMLVGTDLRAALAGAAMPPGQSLEVRELRLRSSRVSDRDGLEALLS